MGRTCKEDDKLITEIYNSNLKENGFLHIMDARPKVNAMGNKAKGLGIYFLFLFLFLFYILLFYILLLFLLFFLFCVSCFFL